MNLKEALENGELEAFASQAETQGIGPIDTAEFEARLGRFIEPQPEDQTSRSPDYDCSPEK